MNPQRRPNGFRDNVLQEDSSFDNTPTQDNAPVFLRTPDNTPTQDNAPVFPRTPDALGRRNRALQAVPPLDWERFSSLLHRSVLVPGNLLFKTGQEVERVYFPHSGGVSLIALDTCHPENVTQTIEAVTVRHEGVVGVMEALAGEPSLHHAQVQLAGTASWMEAATLREEFRRGGPFTTWLLRYFCYMEAATTQAMVCGRFHSIEERLAHWLLLMDEGLAGGHIETIHETIAQLLGTRRSGVTVALGVLQRAGFIESGRGYLRVINRTDLEGTACNCYQKLRRQRGRLWQE